MSGCLGEGVREGEGGKCSDLLWGLFSSRLTCLHSHQHLGLDKIG